MKIITKTIAAALVILFSAGVIYAQPQIKWLETKHDFGAFNESLEKVTTTFLAVNTGDEPLVVLSARANCGCTTPKYTKGAVEPGDTLEVTVSYDASGRPGRFEKKIYVTTNDEQRESELTIVGTVIGSSNSLKGRFPVEKGKLRLSNSVMPFGEVFKTGSATAVIKGYNANDFDIKPAVLNSPDYISFKVYPETVPPGEQFVVSGIARPAADNLWGLVTDSLLIVADTSDPDDAIVISTVMIVSQDFSKLSKKERENAPAIAVQEEILDMDHIGWAPGNVTTVESRLINKGKSPLLIRRAYSPDPALKVTTGSDKVNAGKSTPLIIEVDKSKIPAGQPLNARITIITNDPAKPNKIIRIVGEVK